MKAPIRRKIFELSGEGQTNLDGTSRQVALFASHPGDLVILKREPHNRWDCNAIFVTTQAGIGLGYINREDAAELAPIMDRGLQHTAVIHRLTGGLQDYPSHGCVISIVWNDTPAHRCLPLDDAQLDYRRHLNVPRQHGRQTTSTQSQIESWHVIVGAVGLLILAYFIG